MMNPLNNLSPIPAPLMNKTTYRDCFRSKSPAANVNEFENLLKSKRDKNVKFDFYLINILIFFLRNPLSTNFRSPFETENQAKFKKYEITKVPSRIEKKV